MVIIRSVDMRNRLLLANVALQGNPHILLICVIRSGRVLQATDSDPVLLFGSPHRAFPFDHIAVNKCV